jgi:CBS domain containing-hemolysin-like protein
MIVSFVITFLILLFGEIIPKVIATRFSLKLGILVAPVIYFFSLVLFPIVIVLEGIVKILNKLFA